MCELLSTSLIKMNVVQSLKILCLKCLLFKICDFIYINKCRGGYIWFVGAIAPPLPIQQECGCVY